MRVIAGIYRHRLLVAPEGLATRPTLDRVKVSLFNILQPYLHNARVLDLFAGSGALGIEALSRGASMVVMNDVSSSAQHAIRTNLLSLHIQEQVEVFSKDYLACLSHLASQKAQFEVVLLDPPFEAGFYENILTQLHQLDLVVPGGVILVECPKPMKIDVLQEWFQRNYYYGDVQLRLYRRPRV